MAYDAAAAHEYYIKYRKKGLKKGRKKGTSKVKSGTTSLLGTSIAGFNDEGRIQAALIKDKLKKEMNEALKKASSDEEKEKIRIEYSRKAVQQIAALKNNAQYAKPKATKSSSGKSSGSKSRERSEKSENTNTKNSENTNTKNSEVTTSAKEMQPISPEEALKLIDYANTIMSKLGAMTEDQKKITVDIVNKLLERLKASQGNMHNG